MKGRFLASVAAVAFLAVPGAAFAQNTSGSSQTEGRQADSSRASAASDEGAIIVTATRREERLQDVPLSVTAYSQEDLNKLGIVGYEGVAQNTPGIVVNRPTQNFNNFTARGINTNGYSAGLQSAVAIYIDELPISANGNSTILDPNLYDVERVEFLRGPQGTLFGSSSLAGAMRIITHSPDLNDFQASALVDFALTGSDSLRQRYNGMVNIPIIQDGMALRVVGFYRNEDGWVDNVGTGIEDSNTLKDYGGRAILEMRPSDRLSVRLMAAYENSKPLDSALTNPNLGTYVRRTDQPDRFWAELSNYNVTVNYDLDFAQFISSTTLSKFDQLFVVDLAGTFNQAIAFGLDAFAYDDLFVEEARLVSRSGGPFEWVAGFFYFDKRRTVDFNYRSSLEFLQSRNLTGLPDQYYQRFQSYTDISEIAGFGELTYHISDNLWLTGGLRYTNSTVQSFTREGGYNSNYLAVALSGLTNFPITVTPIPAAVGLKVEDDRVSWKASISWRPTPEITTYATVATGFRPPVVNAYAGRPSLVDPSDIVIPDGAASDKLTNYEVGLKGRWLGGNLTANIAAYYIDWRDIQVQANRVSDSIQFATNIGGARSYGVEWEIFARPFRGLSIALNGSLNDAKVNRLTALEAAISGAVNGVRLASPHFQGSATVRYDFAVSPSTDAYIAANVSHAGSFPNQFPNVPGNPSAQSPTYDYTDAWTNVNLYAGTTLGRVTLTAYVENLLDDSSVTYVHPEAFLDSRYARLRPRTVGIRANFQF